MDIFNSLKNSFFKIADGNFEDYALDLFQIQVKNNKIYNNYIRQLKVIPSEVRNVSDIPFLPIEFFKHFDIKSGGWEVAVTFESSGTTDANPSRHLLPELGFYHRVTTTAFEQQYGPLKDFAILALLPSYVERGNSSLVAMVNHFVQKSNSEYSGYYLENQRDLLDQINDLKDWSGQILLIGVSFALMDFAEKMHLSAPPNMIIMETGGMKGRRKELTREDLHSRLKQAFGVRGVHSEYGMTELLSQAYSKEEGEFYAPPWMRVVIRDILDPFQLGLRHATGGINVIDLANLHSCAFIETRDLGVSMDNRRFKVLGRMDNSDLRGCNLMVD